MYRLSRVLFIFTFLLIIAGGLVTSTGSGLAVPDWPLSYGQLMPPMVGGILFEHGHRMVASTVGFLTLIFTVIVGFREKRRWVRMLAIAALGAVVLQGILGGMTVLLKLPPPVSIAHACLAQTFFLLVVTLACIFGKYWPADRSWTPSSETRVLRAWAAAAFASTYLQLVLGASLRHIGWSHALLIAHLLNAVVATVLVFRTAFLAVQQTQNPRRFTRIGLGLASLLFIQFVLGAATYLTHRSVWVATAHVATGAALLATTWVLLLRTTGNELKALGSKAHGRMEAYFELTKPRLTLMAVITAVCGFYLGSGQQVNLSALFFVALGSAVVGAGAGALNQYLEREQDAKMVRTQKRPLPQNRIRAMEALIIGVVLSVLGIVILEVGTHRLTAMLGLLTLGTYIAIYTPLKTRTVLCTLIGAIPGALPPLMGWTAARGLLDAEAGVLFAVLFLWQLPHFLALAWIYRDDYERAGFKMLPMIDPQGGMLGRQIALYCLALVPVSLIPTFSQIAGPVYFLAALSLSLVFFGVGVAAAVAHTAQSARRLFRMSLLYLPMLMTFMALDKVVF